MPVKKANQSIPNHLLRQARLEMALSQREVADHIGASHSFMISRWEQGTAFPGSQYRQRLCTLLKKSPEELGFIPEATASPSLTLSIYDPVIYHPSNLAAGLVGRDGLYEQLRSLLCDHTSAHTVALDGLPGGGKTALVIKLLNNPTILQHFSDGILWCGLGRTPDISMHVSRWAHLLGIHEQDIKKASTPMALQQALRARIGHRRMLIVIDDAWSIDDVWSCHIGAPNCSYLLTTRFSDLAVQFAGSHTIHVKELDEHDGMLLLQHIAPTVVEEEPSEVRALVKNVGGLPLALTLIGKYLLAHARFRQRRRLLTALQRLHSTHERLSLKQPIEAPDHYPSLATKKNISLKAVIGLSDEALDDTARRVFYALSLFPPKPTTFSEEAALAVGMTGPDILDLLVDVGLLEYHAEARYTMHQTIVDYARLNGPDPDAVQCFVHYFVDYIQHHKTAYTQLEIEVSAIFAALEYARQYHLSRYFCQGVCTLNSFLLTHGRYDLALSYLEQARNLLQPVEDATLYAQVLHKLGGVQERKGEYQQAEQNLQTALQSARQIQDDYLIARILVSLVLCLERRGAYEQIEQYLEEGLRLAQDQDDPLLKSKLLTLQGQVYVRSGHYAKAEAIQQEGLELARQSNDEEHIAGLLINVATIQERREKYAEAHLSLQEARELAKSFGNTEQLCLILSNLGSILIYLEQDVEAENVLIEGKTLAENIENPMYQTGIIINLGSIALKHKDYQKSEICFQQALSTATTIGHREMIAWIHHELGTLYQQQNNYLNARYHFLLAQEQSAEPDVLAASAYALARISLQENNIVDARHYGEQSLSIYQQLTSPKHEELRSWLETLPALE